jgi:hypothetical protein
MIAEWIAVLTLILALGAGAAGWFLFVRWQDRDDR